MRRPLVLSECVYDYQLIGCGFAAEESMFQSYLSTSELINETLR